MEKIITEQDISRKLNRFVKAPIRVGGVRHLGLDTAAFLDFFSPLFQELPWDPYDARRLRMELLQSQLPEAADELQSMFAGYYTGQLEAEQLTPWVEKLSKERRAEYEAIQPWRRRSVSQFMLSQNGKDIRIEREPVEQFAQAVESDDFRTLPRVFAESPDHHVDNDWFRWLLVHFFHLAKAVKKDVRKARITAHFMSVRSTAATPGDNSPEGAHEDGADFIVSALVINRINVEGGETQIIEQLPDGEREIIFRKVLAPGQFCFQADTREEVIYGNDLWHHVTPFHLADPNQGEGWRDIIGFDIITG